MLTPLKNDGVRQLGWWHSQYDGKIMFQSTNQRCILLYSWFDFVYSEFFIYMFEYISLYDIIFIQTWFGTKTIYWNFLQNHGQWTMLAGKHPWLSLAHLIFETDNNNCNSEPRKWLNVKLWNCPRFAKLHGVEMGIYHHPQFKQPVWVNNIWTIYFFRGNNERVRWRCHLETIIEIYSYTFNAKIKSNSPIWSIHCWKRG
jgi:hypothetical protein